MVMAPLRAGWQWSLRVMLYYSCEMVSASRQLVRAHFLLGWSWLSRVSVGQGRIGGSSFLGALWEENVSTVPEGLSGLLW